MPQLTDLPEDLRKAWTDIFRGVFQRNDDLPEDRRRRVAARTAWGVIDKFGRFRNQKGHYVTRLGRTKNEPSLYAAAATDTVEKQANHAGVMICFYPDRAVAEKLAVSSGEPADDLHLTLAYLGDTKDIPPESLAALVERLEDFASDEHPLSGMISGIGRFFAEGEHVAYASVDLPDLPHFRQELVEEIEKAGIILPNTHGYTPHITLSYISPDAAMPMQTFQPIPVYFGKLSIVIAGERKDLVLGGPYEDMHDAKQEAFVGQIMKADAAKRYTFSVVYKSSPDGFDDPNLDAHREFATPEELFEARVGYVQGGDRNIYKQHGLIPGIGMKRIGEWVDIVQWPHEVEADFVTSNGRREKRTIPKDSVFMGVVWTEEAWADVLSGKIRGYSFGGKAKRLTVD